MEPTYLVSGRVFPDDLADMSVVNFPNTMSIARVFSIKANEDTFRGNHAHKECWQVIFTINYPINIVSNFGNLRNEYEIYPLSSALIVPPMNWLKLNCPQDSVVVVLASEKFSEDDYLRDFEEYIKIFDIKKQMGAETLTKC
jgi:hypothetical protein